MNINSLPARRKLEKGVGYIVITISLIYITHFSISIWTWAYYGIWVPLFVLKTKQINLWQLLQAFPSILFFSCAVIVIVLARKKIHIAATLLIIVVGASVLCFVLETSNDLYQMEAPTSHIGSQYSYMTIGYRYYYWNWWWYTEAKSYQELLSEESKENQQQKE